LGSSSDPIASTDPADRPLRPMVDPDAAYAMTGGEGPADILARPSESSQGSSARVMRRRRMPKPPPIATSTPDGSSHAGAHDLSSDSDSDQDRESGIHSASQSPSRGKTIAKEADREDENDAKHTRGGGVIARRRGAPRSPSAAGSDVSEGAGGGASPGSSRSKGRGGGGIPSSAPDSQ